MKLEKYWTTSRIDGRIISYDIKAYDHFHAAKQFVLKLYNHPELNLDGNYFIVDVHLDPVDKSYSVIASVTSDTRFVIAEVLPKHNKT